MVLSENGNVAIPPPAQKTFDAEGEALERALTKSLLGEVLGIAGQIACRLKSGNDGWRDLHLGQGVSGCIVPRGRFHEGPSTCLFRPSAAP